MKHILSICVLFMMFLGVFAGITPFNLDLPPNTYVSERIGVFMKDKVPFSQLATHEPYGQWQFTFTISKGNFSKASTHMMVGTSEQIDRIGVSYEHTNFFCCTDYLVFKGKCNESNTIAFPPDMNPYESNGTFYYFPIEFGLLQEEHGEIAQGGIGPYRINITQQGIWYLLIVNCNDNVQPKDYDNDEHKRSDTPSSDQDDPLDSTTVRLTGTSVWMNPYGYLPGQLYGQMPVYWTLTILYFFFAVAWAISCCCHHHWLHPVQYAMLAVLIVSWFENMVWGAAFVRYNVTGINDNVWNGFGTFFLALKLTISRTMLLLICMGYSITHTVISRAQQLAVLGLALCYFIIVAASHFVTVLQEHGEQISYASKMLLVFLDFIVSGTMFAWIFTSLHWTRQELAEKKETKKSRMYTALAVCIGLAFGISFLIFCGEFIVQMLSLEDKLWIGEFFFTLYWEVAFFFILIAVAIIWRPHRENNRYAHIEADGFIHEEEMTEMDNELSSPH